MNHETQAGIDCPIDLFPGQETEISQLTQAINQAPTAAEKKPRAEALIEAVDVLLACDAYDEANLNCGLCHRFSELRRKTAELVVKAGHLEERRRSSGDRHL